MQRQGRFSSVTRLDYLQIIERKVRLNPGEGVDFSGLIEQINNNNQNCYGLNRGACEPEEEDYILEEGGQKYLVIRSRFLSRGNSYVWSTE